VQSAGSPLERDRFTRCNMGDGCQSICLSRLWISECCILYEEHMADAGGVDRANETTTDGHICLRMVRCEKGKTFCVPTTKRWTVYRDCWSVELGQTYYTYRRGDNVNSHGSSAETASFKPDTPLRQRKILMNGSGRGKPDENLSHDTGARCQGSNGAGRAYRTRENYVIQNA